MKKEFEWNHVDEKGNIHNTWSIRRVQYTDFREESLLKFCPIFSFMSLFFLGNCFDLTHFGLTSNLIYDEVISRKKLKLTRAQFAPFSSTSVSVLVSYYQNVPLPPVDLWPNLSNFSIRNWIESKTSWFDKFFLKFPHPFLVKYLREQSTDARFSRQNSKFKFCNWMKNIHKSYYVT